MSGIPAWAVRGAKVVCVSETDDPLAFDFGPNAVIGEIYTVDRVGLSYGGTGRPIISLVELPSIHPTMGELGFDLIDFRPLVTRSQEQDLGLFLPLLKPQKLRERA